MGWVARLGQSGLGWILRKGKCVFELHSDNELDGLWSDLLQTPISPGLTYHCVLIGAQGTVGPVTVSRTVYSLGGFYAFHIGWGVEEQILEKNWVSFTFVPGTVLLLKIKLGSSYYTKSSLSKRDQVKFVPSLFSTHISHQYLWCYKMPLVTQKYHQFLEKTGLSNCPLYTLILQPFSASFKYSNPLFSSLPSIFFHMTFSDELCLSLSARCNFYSFTCCFIHSIHKYLLMSLIGLHT